MSMGDTVGYHRPRVEDTFSEAGDRPPNTASNSRRHRPPPLNTAAGQKAATARSASDSGYSSKPASAANPASLNGSVKEETIHDVQEESTRRPMPYNNTHRQGKESLAEVPKKEVSSTSGTKKAKPKPIATRPAPGAMAPPPMPPAYQRPQPSPQHRPSLPYRVNTTSTSYAPQPSLMGPQATPHLYQQHPPFAYPSAGPPQMPSYPSPAIPSASHGSFMPNYSQSQPMQHSYSQPSSQHYGMAHAAYPAAPSPYPQAHYSSYPPPLSLSFGPPALTQRPPIPPSRHTTPMLHQPPTQQHTTYSQVRDPREVQAMVLREPRRALHVEEPRRPARRPGAKQNAHRRRSREQSSDSESHSSASDSSSSEDEEEDGRTSPRKALQRAKSSYAHGAHTGRNTRRDSDVSHRRSGDHPLRGVQDDEKAKLSRMEDYQRNTATPLRRQTDVPRYIEDTARATKAASPASSEESPTPLSPTRSRTSASYSDNRSKRNSLVVSAKSQLTYRQTVDGYTFDAPEGQQITLTITNGKEKRYSAEGSTASASRVQRQASNAGSNRTRESSYAKTAKGPKIVGMGHGDD